MKNGAGSLRKLNENKPFQIYLNDNCYFMVLLLLPRKDQGPQLH